MEGTPEVIRQTNTNAGVGSVTASRVPSDDPRFQSLASQPKASHENF